MQLTGALVEYQEGCCCFSSLFLLIFI